MLLRLLLAAVALASPRAAFERLAPAISKEVGEPVQVRVERVSGNRIDFDVVYRQGDADRFVGYAAGDRVSRLTACFVREFYGKLCVPAPRAGAEAGIPEWILPGRFTHPLDPGLIRPEALAVATDGSLLILDSYRRALFRRSPEGALHLVLSTTASAIAVAPNGSIYLGDGKGIRVVAHGVERTLLQRVGQVSSLAFAPDGTLYVGANSVIVAVTPNGSTRTVFRAGPKFDQIVVRGRRYGGFGADDMTVGGNGDLFVFSFATKQIFEITPRGQPLRAWETYAHGVATAVDGSVIIGTQFGLLQRIRGGKLSTLADLTRRPLGFGFQEDGVAVAPDGTIYTDTFVGNGYTDQTALAAVTPDGHAHLLPITSPLAATLPPGMTTGCPSASKVRSFDAAAEKAAIRAAQVVDIPPFERGLSLSDPSWWSGFYTDQIDGRYGIGRHPVYTVGPASADPYATALVRRCGVALVHRSIAIVVGPGVYSDQVSHMFFLDRDGRALLYWQHT